MDTFNGVRTVYRRMQRNYVIIKFYRCRTRAKVKAISINKRNIITYIIKLVMHWNQKKNEKKPTKRRRKQLN